MQKVNKGQVMEWKDIWKNEPPRNEEIFFMTGDEDIHIGEIFSEEKLRKCLFHSFNRKADYGCDSKTPYSERVIYWFPIPKQPERLNPEDVKDFGMKAEIREDSLCYFEDGRIFDLSQPINVCDSPNSENK
jgi:hypothetical protein